MPTRHAPPEVVEAAYAPFAADQPHPLLPFCAPDRCWQAPGLMAFMPLTAIHPALFGAIAEEPAHD